MTKDSSRETPGPNEHSSLPPSADVYVETARLETDDIARRLEQVSTLGKYVANAEAKAKIHTSDLEALKNMDMIGSDTNPDDDYGIRLDSLSPETRAAFLASRSDHQRFLGRHNALPTQRQKSDTDS